MAERDRPHIIVPTTPATEPFSPVGQSVTKKAGGFEGNRPAHGQRLTREFESVFNQSDDDGENKGTYISFVSFPGLELAIESLESHRRGEQPELVAVQEERNADGLVVTATVFIPNGKKEFFLNKLKEYAATAEDATGKPKNAALIEGIASIKRATIRELWTDPADEFPALPAELRWWEVWLKKSDGKEHDRLAEYARRRNLRTSDHYLGFGERTVILLQTTAEQLSEDFRSIDDIAELRRPHEVSSFLPNISASEQTEWVRDLQSRVEHAEPGSPVVCILDRGVQAGHPLLEKSLASSDLHAVESGWRADAAICSHGTEMAGLALYGDVQAAVTTKHQIKLGHRLESVKILPDAAGNDPDEYGAVTARAVDLPEITAPDRPRVFMLAITAPEAPPNPGSNAQVRRQQESGRPTVWSATIDALAFGRAIDDTSPKFTYLDRNEAPKPRIFVISAGNIRDIRAEDDHLDRSDAEAVEDPS